MKILSRLKNFLLSENENSDNDADRLNEHVEASTPALKNTLSTSQVAKAKEVKPKISEMLLSEIKTWEVVNVPSTLYHGCHIQDEGIDLENNEISGNKWLSTSPYYAASYAWHLSRPPKPSPNSKYCVKVEVGNKNHKVVVRPKLISSFPDFLAQCFPDIPKGYGLSRNFQNVLKAHLDIVFGKDSDVIGYYWPSSDDSEYDEILIPNCNHYFESKIFIPLPNDKSLLSDWSLNLHSSLSLNSNVTKGHILTLYHGTRNRFEVFDQSFYKTGEGVADFKGWYFCISPKGALAHCETYLHCRGRDNDGYILECQIESQFVEVDIEGHLTEPIYDGVVYGVPFEYSAKIKVVRVHSTREVFESIYGKIVEIPNY